MLRIFVLLVLLIMLPAGAAEKSFMYRTSSAPPVYSRQLGVMAIPVYVIIDNSRRNGIYVQSAPTLELGRNMGLTQGMVLLTMDGHSISSAQDADDWINRRSPGNVQYTYVTVVKGKPAIRMAQGGYSKVVNNPSVVVQSSSQASTDELESYSFSLINASRGQEGLPALQQDSSLARLARQYAEYMAQNAQAYDVYGSRNPHIDLQGRSPAERAHESGISTFASENIGRGTRGFAQSDKGTIGEIHRQMMAEPFGVQNHRASIMDPQSRRVGVGVARSNTRIFMAQEFGI